MFSTQPGWMSPVTGTHVLCPSPSPTAPCPARAQALAPVTDQAPAQVHVRALSHVRHLTPTPTCVNPIVPARDQAIYPANVKAPDHVMARDRAQALSKGPLFPHYPTVFSLKGHHLQLSLMLLTPLPLAFLLSQTFSALCLCILPGCCLCATAAWPISSWWRPNPQCENGLCAERMNPWRPACSAWSVSARQRRISEPVRQKRKGR